MKTDVRPQEVPPNAKFLIKENEVEISGPEDFVNKQIENFKDSILSRLEAIPLEKNLSLPLDNRKLIQLSNPSSIKSDDVIEYVQKNDSSIDSSNLENVFVTNNGQINVIADVPGNNTSQKMINVILVYMWAKLQQGVEDVSFTELRDMAEKYGEVDKPNFSKIMNTQKKLFLITGEKKSQSAKLVRPGTKAAEKLIAELSTQI